MCHPTNFVLVPTYYHPVFGYVVRSPPDFGTMFTRAELDALTTEFYARVASGYDFYNEFNRRRRRRRCR